MRRRTVVWAAALAFVCASSFVFARGDRAAAARPTDWPAYLHDIAHSSNNQSDTTIKSSNAAQLVQAWSYPTGAIIAAAPTVSDGYVYVGSWDGYEYAINAKSGILHWRTFLGITDGTTPCGQKAGVTSGATVDGGVVYLGGGDSYFYALDAVTGAVLWTAFTGDNSLASGHYNWSSPAIYNGYAYVGVASLCDNPLVQGELLRIELTGAHNVIAFKTVPDTQVGGGVWGSPAIDASTSTVFFTTGNGDTTASLPEPYAQSIVAIDSNTMTLKSYWHDPYTGGDSDWGTSPVLFTDSLNRKLVTATNKDGNVYAFTRANLAAGPVWQQQIAWPGPCPECNGDGSVSTAAFDGTRIYASGGRYTINGIDVPGTVNALDPATGNFIWERSAPGIVLAATALANDLVIDGAGTNVEVRSAATGAVLYSYTTGGVIYGAATAAEGHLFASSTDGSVYAFSPLDTDGDGCPDANEPMLVPPTDPLNAWDFYSVPVPALFAVPDPTTVFKDNIVRAADAQAVFAYYKKAAKTGSLEYEEDLNGNGIKDGLEYDRSLAGPGKSGPPDGMISASDAQLAFAQFKLGYAC